MTDIDCDQLFAHGVRGVILDLDNTLTEWGNLEISTEVETWVLALRACGIAACIVSNAASTQRVRPVADRLNLPWITRAGKPLPLGFRRGMQRMGTTPDTTAVVGDQMLTDIFGGNSLGLLTVLVEPISAREALATSLIQRPIERWLGRPPTMP